MKYRIEVQAPGPDWTGNGIAFATLEAAEASARDLASRWTLVTDWRVVAVPDATGLSIRHAPIIKGANHRVQL